MPRILHLSRNPKNGHPAWLAELQRRHGWESKLCCLNPRETGQRPYPNDIKHTDRQDLKSWGSACSIIHLHDDLTLSDPFIVELVKFLPSTVNVVHQYYHERNSLPESLRRYNLNRNEYPIVTAKKAALLEPQLPRVPLIIPTWKNELLPIIRRRERLKLVYTPTTTQRFLSYHGTKGKGYTEVKPILDRFLKYLDVEIITNLNWRETQLKCQDADIRLDEIVTGGYGQATLEGLAQGCITISGMSPDVEALLPAPTPTLKATPATLGALLDQILAMGWERRTTLAQVGPVWHKQHYSAEWMHGCYEKAYRDAAAKAGNTNQPQPAERVYQVAKIVTVETAAQKHQNNVYDKQGAKLIVQVAKTNCAGAIWRIHDAINRYTPHSCRTITFSDTTNGRKFRTDVMFGDRGQVHDLLQKADIIHFHNWIDHESADMRPFPFLKDKKKVIQYHTEPRLLQPAFPSKDLINRTDIQTMVIGQKHTRFYPKSLVVPNIMDVEDELLTPDGNKWNGGPLKVIYTPSDIKGYPSYTDTCCGKGYPETIPILKKLQAEGLIDLTLVTDLKWEDLMPIKREQHLCIDEVVTGGYHLCSLEALAQGLVTVAWIDPQTERTIRNLTGCEGQLPWLNTGLAELEANLRSVIAAGPESFEQRRKDSRDWMVRYWHPAQMIKHYLKGYALPEEKQIVRYFGSNNSLMPAYNVPEKIQDDLLKLAGSWSGKQTIIWGNGPTALNAADMVKRGEFSNCKNIGTNAATKLGLNFDAYCIGDSRFTKVPEKLLIAQNAPGVRVYQSVVRPHLPGDWNGNFVRTIGNDGFSMDLTRGVFHGYSVVWLALQLAAYAGSRDVLLAGCGHNYDKNKPRFYEEKQVSEVDSNWNKIAGCYKSLRSLCLELGMTVRTIGPSRLQECGIERLKGT